MSQISNMQVYEPTGKPILYVWLDYQTQSAEPISSGAARYAQHHTTRAYIASVIICEADGLVQPQRFIWTDEAWQLSMPEQWEHVHGRDWLVDLFGDDRYEIWCIAHNTSFERSISEYTLNLPAPARWIDTMDTANSLGLPAGLDKLGAYCYQTPKDTLGKNLMMRLCAPPKHGRNRGILPTITQEDIQNLITYSITDTVVCRRFSLDRGMIILPQHEQEVRDCHHGINHLGIGFDLDYAEKLDSMEQFFTAQARLRVEEVTGGEIKGDDLFRVKFLTDAVNAHLPADLQINNLRARTIEDLLEDAEEREDVEPEVLEVLKSRLIVTRAALDKVRAAMNMVCSDGRIRDQFVYWGAGTGRFSGRGVQPQNLRRPGEEFDIEAAIRAVKARDSAAFLRLCVDEKGVSHYPYELLGSLVRGIFIPRPGHVFVVGDYASIEARMLMWLADQQEGLQEHRDADAGKIDDVYCAFASSIYGYEVRKKTHKKERQAGKVGQLACIAEGTPILTARGWVSIEDVTLSDTVWDGEAFVSHQGLANQGEKECVCVHGVWMTRDHRVLAGSRWVEAGSLTPATLHQAVATGAGSLLEALQTATACADATVAASFPSMLGTCAAGSAPSAGSAEQTPLGSADGATADTPRSSPILASGDGCSTASMPPCHAAPTPQTLAGRATVAGGFVCAPSGWKNRASSWRTSRPFPATTTPAWRWTEPTTSVGTNRATSALYRTSGRPGTPDRLGGSSTRDETTPLVSFVSASAPATASTTPCSGSSMPAWNLTRSSASSRAAAVRTVRTFDLRMCGPRNRYQAGTLIVHNCGYSGGEVAVQRMAFGNRIDLEAAGVTPKDVVNKWRSHYYQVPRYWGEIEQAFKQAAVNRKTVDAGKCRFWARGVDDRTVQIELPSGRQLTYMNARMRASTREGREGQLVLAYDTMQRGAVRTKEVYGGLLTENVDQAASRDCLARTIRAAILEQGYDVPLHVHDEIVLEVPEAEAEEAAAWLGNFMSTPPPWAPTLPLSCKPSIMHRYGKD